MRSLGLFELLPVAPLSAFRLLARFPHFHLFPSSSPYPLDSTRMVTIPNNTVQIGLPKGRMQQGVIGLFADAGIRISVSDRGYRPKMNLPGFEAKLLKPQNILEMLSAGTRDAGFAGADWVAELQADVVEVLDTGLDEVSVVAAAPESLLIDGRLPSRPLVVVSEYARLAQAWIANRRQGDAFVRSYGATEVFPPEDADVILDVTATGATLRANGLAIIETVQRSSTRLYASRSAWANPSKRSALEDLAMVLCSVLSARQRVMLELNVTEQLLDAVVQVLPCMKRPTISKLASVPGDGGVLAYAIKAAVPREGLAQLIPALKQRGGTDVIISPLSQVVP
jgi:ATP phosphoribosyltransferase